VASNEITSQTIDSRRQNNQNRRSPQSPKRPNQQQYHRLNSNFPRIVRSFSPELKRSFSTFSHFSSCLVSQTKHSRYETAVRLSCSYDSEVFDSRSIELKAERRRIISNFGAIIAARIVKRFNKIRFFYTDCAIAGKFQQKALK
jgi:hypothetical protein